MRHYYSRCLAGLSLLLGLAACSSENRAETNAGRAAQPAAAPSASTQNSPTAKTPGRAASQPKSLVWAPAETPASTTQPSPAPHRPRPTRRVARQARRQAKQLAASPYAPAPRADTARGSGVAAPVAASVPAAPAASASGPKLAQVFRIRPDRDTVLYGAEGTVLRIPAGTFGQGRGKKAQPLNGTATVEIKLREFYSMADILLERLSTKAGPTLLETGGMVQLSATTTDGRACKLQPGSGLELGFPATRPLDGMALYDGVATNKPGFSWKLAPQAKQPKARPKSEHWQQPSLLGSYRSTRRALREAIAFAPATVRRLNGGQAPHQLRRQLRRVGKQAPLVGKVEASFEIAEKGGVSDVYLRNAGQTDSVLEAAVVQALRGRLASPSHRGRQPVRSMMKVDVRFTADRRVLVDHLRWDRPTTLAFYKADNERKAMGKQPLTDAQLQAAPLDAVTGALFKSRQANAKRYSVKSYLSEQLNYVKELAVFRVLAVAAPRSVGWYNCDQPLQPPPSLLTRLFRSSKGVVRAPTGGAAKLALVRLGLETPAAQPADISLVLRERRCVIRGDAGTGGRIAFEQLAEGTAATLVAIRREQGQLYLALRDVVVSEHVEPALAFRPVTVAELKAAVAQFDL